MSLREELEAQLAAFDAELRKLAQLSRHDLRLRTAGKQGLTDAERATFEKHQRTTLALFLATADRLEALAA